VIGKEKKLKRPTWGNGSTSTTTAPVDPGPNRDVIDFLKANVYKVEECNSCKLTRDGIPATDTDERIDSATICRGYKGKADKRACIFHAHSLSATRLAALVNDQPHLSPHYKTNRASCVYYMEHTLGATPLGKDPIKGAVSLYKKTDDGDIKSVNTEGALGTKRGGDHHLHVWMGYRLHGHGASSSSIPTPQLPPSPDDIFIQRHLVGDDL